MQMSFGHSEPSTYDQWPTKENPGEIYKLTNIWLEQGLTERIVERQTYSLLELLGDTGGLFDGLRIITKILILPFTRYALRAMLVSSFSAQNQIQSDHPVSHDQESGCNLYCTSFLRRKQQSAKLQKKVEDST